MRIKFLATSILILAFCFYPASAKADSVDFSGTIGSGTSGFLSSGAFTATDSATAQSVPAVAGQTVLGNLTLTFDTGAPASSVDLGGGLVLDKFGAGGSVSVTGCTPNTNCFSGTFTNTQLLVNAGGGTENFTGSFIAGQLDPGLLAALGFAAGTNPNATGSITATFLTSYPGTWSSGDLTLTPAAPVPEPSALVLLGAGLLGLALIARRK